MIRADMLQVFGALTSCALHPSEHFYGTGESLLFAFQGSDEARRQSHAALEDNKHGKDKDANEEGAKDEKEGMIMLLLGKERSKVAIRQV